MLTVIAFLAAGRPYLHAASTLLLLGRPEFVARVRKSTEIRVTPAATRSSALRMRRSPRICSKPLAHGLDRLVGILVVRRGLLPNECLDLVVCDFDRLLVGHTFEHCARFTASLGFGLARSPGGLSRRLVSHRQVGLVDAALLERADEGVQERRRTPFDEWSTPSMADASTSASRRPAGGSSSSLELLGQPALRYRCEAPPASRTRWPTARAHRRCPGRTFSLISFNVTVTFPDGLSSPRSSVTSRVSPSTIPGICARARRRDTPSRASTT